MKAADVEKVKAEAAKRRSASCATAATKRCFRHARTGGSQEDAQAPPRPPLAVSLPVGFSRMGGGGTEI